MKLLILIVILGAFAGIGFAIYRAICAINGRSFAVYGYKPISPTNVLLMTIPYWVILFGYFLGGHANVVVGAFTGAAVLAFVGWRIFKRTSFGIALASGLLLVSTGIIIVAVLIGLSFSRSNTRRR